MAAVLLSWRQQVQRQHRTKHLVAQRVQHAKSELLSAVVLLWRQHVETRQRKTAIIARCHRKHASHLLQQGLFAFSTALQVRKTRESIMDAVSSKAKVSTQPSAAHKPPSPPPPCPPSPLPHLPPTPSHQHSNYHNDMQALNTALPATLQACVVCCQHFSVSSLCLQESLDAQVSTI